MYQPPAFREDRIEVIQEAIRAARFGILVSVGADGEPEASHVPMLLDTEPAPYGTLVGHLARANPQVRAAGRALAIFGGPNAYVSPSWYATKAEHGRVVPTWNYVAIHAAGVLQTTDDPAELHAMVSQLTERHENSRPAPWAVDDAPPDFVASQLRGIIGFRLKIDRLEGKWKMSQNRSREDRAGVARALGDTDPGVARLIPE